MGDAGFSLRAETVRAARPGLEGLRRAFGLPEADMRTVWRHQATVMHGVAVRKAQDADLPERLERVEQRLEPRDTTYGN